MKKWISLLVFCLLLALTRSAVAATAGDWEYDFSGDNVTITRYNGSDSNITIPAELGGKKVTAIGTSAFERNQSIRNVTFEQGSSVTVIGYKAFYNSSLQNISFPGSLTTINERAFLQTKDYRILRFPPVCEPLAKELFQNAPC